MKSFAGLLLILLLLSSLSNLPAATFGVIFTNDSGAGSFRQAINDANTNAGNHTIAFTIPGLGPFTIRPTSPLPGISNVVLIDGTTQTNYSGIPRVEISGTNAGSGATGIYLLSSNCTVRGLAINRFTGDGIRIEGTGGNIIQANFIGTGVYGTNAAGNGNSTYNQGGITILSAGNLIGGTDPTNRNLISGNLVNGIYLLNGGAAGNSIQGNLIGTDITGNSRLPNFTNGIVLLNAYSNLIGGTAAGARNLISGNGQSGIYFFDNANNNVVQGNTIGLNTAGTAALSNATDGITFASVSVGSKNNLIGGTGTAARNIISGNGGRGIVISGSSATGNLIAGNYIGTVSNGMAAVANTFYGVELLNSSSNTIGGDTADSGNLISGNGFSGVKIGSVGGGTHTVQNNLIGTDKTGTNALPNLEYGIFIQTVSSNTIGPGNVVSGNLFSGILLTTNTTANTILGNFIGTDPTGLRRLGNTQNGIRIESPGNTIGGLTPAARNIISGNTNNGIYFSGTTASNNLIQGNFIGTDINGTAAVGNTYAGVGIVSARQNTIGGITAATRNLISGNNLQGIYIISNSAANNTIQGNYIGTDTTGSYALPNGFGLATVPVGGGLDLSGGANSNLIGGTNTGAGNLISGNWRDAITLGDAGTTSNVIQGNFIGVKADGISDLGNETHGIDLRSTGGVNNNTIGGVTPGAGNTIAFARTPGYDGVRVRDGNTGNLIRRNSTFSNGDSIINALGIDLGNDGVNANDGCDGDTGGNLLQNFPVLTNTFTSGGITRVQGTLNSTASKTYQLDFYANTATNDSGCGEGQYYLGSTNVTTDGSCNGSFTFTLPAASVIAQYITATATDPNNNTSELSTNIPAKIPTIVTQPQNQVSQPGSNATFTVTAAGSGTLNYQWRTNGIPKTGATSATLALSNLTTNDALNYSVIITNIYGAVTSSAATLTVLLAPAITQQPQSRTNIAGTTATFTVTALGASPMNYQWRSNGIAKAGATSATLTLNNVTTNDTLNYSVIVTNIYGAVTSSAAALTVVLSPAISQSPQNLTNYAGTTATFTITATGTAPLTYQWRTNGVNKIITTTGSLILNNVTTNDALNYDVVVANPYGAATSAVATLTVYQPPVITQSPQSLTNVLGTTATFTVAAYGTAPLTYQWRTNGVTKTGATNTTLILNNVTTNDALNYDIVVANPYGAATSAIATLTITLYANNVVISQIYGGGGNAGAPYQNDFVELFNPTAAAVDLSTKSMQYATANNTAWSVARLTGTIQPYHYYLIKLAAPGSPVGIPLPTPDATTNFNLSALAGKIALVINQTALVGTNPVGLPEVIDLVGYGFATGYEGAGAAPGAPGGDNATSTLRKNGGYTDFNNNATDFTTLSPPVARNSASPTNPTPAPPLITAQPASITLAPGDTASFSVSSTGSSPLAYQWRWNGTNISGANTNTYSKVNAQPTNSGNYDVVITNTYGAVTSSIATLAVISFTPTLTTLYSNGVPSNRINIVLLAEGYKTNEFPQFLVDAANVASNLLATPPYNEYTNYFNAYSITVASAESGSDHYTPSTSLKNTYFNSTYDSYSIPRLITVPPNDRDANTANGTGKIQTLLTNATLFPNQPWAATVLPQINANNRLVVLVVNDTSYGGSGQPPDPANPFPIAVTSLGSIGGVSALDIVAHESGHTFANLADEYSTAFPGFTPTEHANATTQTNLNSVPWKTWILNGVPSPTPDVADYSSLVGVFEGAQYQTNGWYRPRHDCKMSHLGIPFCEVCSEAIVIAINQKVRTIETYTPTTNNNQLTAITAPAIAFSTTRLQPSTHDLNLQWFTNGTAVPGATASTFLFSPANFTNGNAALQVRATDATALVRNDPGNALSNAVSWNINIALTRLQLLSSRWQSNGQFTFTVSGTAPFGFVIQASTNLADWMPIATNSLTNGVFTFTNTPGFPQRYYRTVFNP